MKTTCDFCGRLEASDPCLNCGNRQKSGERKAFAVNRWSWKPGMDARSSWLRVGVVEACSKREAEQLAEKAYGGWLQVYGLVHA